MIAGVGLDDWYKIAGVIIAVPAVVAIVWFILQAASHVIRVHEAISGRPSTEFSEKIPSMIERFQEVTAHLERQDAILKYVKSELTYNGGGSTKDQVRKVDRKIDALTLGQAQAIGREGTIAGTAVATAAALHDETVVTAADVADLAVEVAKDLATKAPAKKATARKRVAKKPSA